MAVDFKVIGPEVLPGMKQAHELAAGVIDGGYVAAFSAIAKNAGVGEVFEKRIAAMFAADDVVYLGAEGSIVFVDQAVFATAVGAEDDVAAKRRGDVIGHWRESGARGLWPFLGCVRVP